MKQLVIILFIRFAIMSAKLFTYFRIMAVVLIWLVVMWVDNSSVSAANKSMTSVGCIGYFFDVGSKCGLVG